ncbi:GntR family transcriptional regulator [Sphingomonas sp.]|jgi:DNA-binding GntR family transcriptional regulator|uniref:GntR family transcriptional regulator n=1 Tax=Sphingomonas sp. TaxID=28214 RepID=UPI002E307370|nr:GntR family transcriptional regulator [Sphingomonas sp.]HEX4693595.1 GntR family transcriptional regulator [Sphingomonas sp.]
MNAGATAERVYDALKRHLLSGDVAPGCRLEPALLGEQLVSSVTPVRDALHRLIGERLVETHSGTGFHLVSLNEPDLRDLYAWNAQLLLDAVRWWPNTAPRTLAALTTEPIAATRDLFGQIGRLTGNAEIAVAIAAASDRLEATRHAEALTLDGVGSELGALHAALARAGRAEVARLVRAYHRRRLLAVPAIVRALYRPAAPA